MKALKKPSLEELISLFRQMADREWRDGRLHGRITINDEAVKALLCALLDEENSHDYPISSSIDDPDKIRMGDSIDLEFGLIRTGIGLIVPDLETLLRGPNLVTLSSRRWYLVGDDLASHETNEVVSRFAVLRRLIEALEGAAAVVDERKGRIIFLRKGLLEVLLRTDAKTFSDFDLEVAERVISFLKTDDTHRDQRHEICATVIADMLVRDSPESRFSHLLNSLGEFLKLCEDSYRLFASAFSFERIRDQAQSLKIEYLGKIHKTISDIQGQLLGIPISTVVVATQFKDVCSIPDSLKTPQMWINTSVLIGAFIFCLFLTLAVINQKHTLSALEGEVERHKKSLEVEYLGLKTDLGAVFDQIKGRACWHRFGLNAVLVIGWIAFAFGAWIYWRFTRGAWLM